MLKNYLGVILYYLLPSHLSYNLLSDDDKLIIDEANFSHNNYRKDYFDPLKYQNGKSWYTNITKQNDDYRGYKKIIESVLQNNPQSILEIGFGTGYYTKNLIRNNSTKYYCGIDINTNFVEFMKKIFIEENIDKKINYNLIQGDISKTKNHNRKYDLVIFISSFHHIFHRKFVFETLYEITNKNATVIMIEPTHYLPRIAKILFKGFVKYFKKKSWSNKNNLSTHHFITIDEIKSYINKKFEINKIEYINQSGFAKKYLFLFNMFNKNIYKKYFSSEIGIIVKKI